MERRKFLSLVGITVTTPLAIVYSKPVVKCEDCKFYLPDLEVDGYDLLTHREIIGYSPRRKGFVEPPIYKALHNLAWPPKNSTGHKNKTNEHTFTHAKKGDYCFLIAGLCKRIPCKCFLNKEASEKEAKKIVEEVRKLLKVPISNKNRKSVLDGESEFKIDLRCHPDYRITQLGKLLGRLQIR